MNTELLKHISTSFNINYDDLESTVKNYLDQELKDSVNDIKEVEDSIKIIDYTEKSFCLVGEKTKSIKEEIKANSGKWNSNLTHPKTGEKFGGWIFPMSKKTEIRKLFKIPL